MSDVTQLLIAIDAGDPKAGSKLLPLVYEQLRGLAVVRMAHEKPEQKLQATALVHEAWLKIAGDESICRSVAWFSPGSRLVRIGGSIRVPSKAI